MNKNEINYHRRFISFLGQKMLTLHLDTVLQICGNLPDRGKISLSASSKQLGCIRYNVLYREQVYIKHILCTSYFDRFTNLYVSDTEHALPKEATHLEFSGTFDQIIGKFINVGVTHVIFGSNFNQSILGCLPASITHLKFGKYFDQQIYDSIPDSVVHIEFGTRFNQSVKNCVPKSVTYLKFGELFNCPVSGNLPHSITHLIFGEYYNQSLDNLPPFLTHLKLNCYSGSPVFNLPKSVTHLTLKFCTFLEYLVKCTHVTHLTLKNRYDQIRVPLSVTHLTFGDQFYGSISGIIPESCTHLTIFSEMLQLPLTIPESIVEIKLPTRYSLPISDNILSHAKIIR